MDQRNGDHQEIHRNPPSWFPDIDDHRKRHFSGDGDHHKGHHDRRQNPNFEPNDSAAGFSFGRSVPLPGHKRPLECVDGGGFVKLYVVGIPRTATEDDVRSVFAEHGHIIEVVPLKDKRSGIRREAWFVKYRTLDEADRTIGALHDRYTFPGSELPLTIRYADGERERLGSFGEHKVYVGGLSKQASKKEIEDVFSPYGTVFEVFIVRDEKKQNRGCAFIQFARREMAVAAISALHGTYVMKVCEQPLIVRFAAPKKPRLGDSRGQSHMYEPFGGHSAAYQSMQHSPNQIPNNRSKPQSVFSTCVGPEKVFPSATSSINAGSVNTEMVESIDCEWSEHICPDGFSYYYNCVTCESRWEKPEVLALFENQIEKVDQQQQIRLNSKSPAPTTPEVTQMHQQLDTASAAASLVCV